MEDGDPPGGGNSAEVRWSGKGARMVGLFRSSRSCVLWLRTAKLLIRNAIISDAAFTTCCKRYKPKSMNKCPINIFRGFSSMLDQQIPWQGSSSVDLLAKLEIALKENCVEEAWESFNDYRNVHGFPKQSLVSGLLVALSYSSQHHWLRKAYELVVMAHKEKAEILHFDSLTKLVLALARAQIPVPASIVARILSEKYRSPSMDIWGMLFFHMVKSEIGSHLASNILIEICERFLDRKKKRTDSRYLNPLKPSTTLFNIVLDACLQHGNVAKGLTVIDMMSRVGVVADANSIILIACLYEMNGQRDNLMNLEEHVNCISSSALSCHQIFYDCLLSLHFKFNDIDSAAKVMLNMYTGHRNFNCTATRELEVGKSHEIQIGSNNLNMGYKIKAKPEELLNDFVLQMEYQPRLVIIRDGKIFPSSNAFAKLICGYLRDERVEKLISFLADIYKETDSSEDATLCDDVIGACVELGWLETAHDMLEGFDSQNISITPMTYRSLFNKYCAHNRFEEADILLKQMRGADLVVSNGMPIELLKDSVNFFTDEKSVSFKEMGLTELLDAESKADIRASELLHDSNSSICFFCKSGMMEDAIRTFRKMQENHVQATVQTFSYLLSGYSSLEMYREVTILWGEIKRRLEDGDLCPDRDLLDELLWNFIKGGYFERAMEIIFLMNHHNMHIDKLKYRREFLKHHRSLYRNLRASDTRTDVQKKRLEHVQAFRRWAGIGVNSYKGPE